MSISILNRGGASGGLKPELTVIAPSGSTIDILQNGSIVDTYTLGVDETKHTFSVNVGTCIVRGTRDDETVEAEVVIDVVGQYETKIDYQFNYVLLYDHGDEHEDITGGFSGCAVTSQTGYSTAAPSVTKNADHIYITHSAANSLGCMLTNNAVDVTDYARLGLYIYSNTSGNRYPWTHAACMKSRSGTGVAKACGIWISGNTTFTGWKTGGLASIKIFMGFSNDIWIF